MDKAKKLSVNTFDKIIKENIEDKVVVNFYDNEVVVNKYLTLTDMIKFVNEVVNGCFDDDTGEYLPEVKRFLIDRNTVAYYVNANLPSDYAHLYEILCKTGIADTIRQSIDKRQYNDILEAIDNKIDTKIYTNEQMFTNKLNTAISSMESLSQNVTDIFKDMTPEQMSAALGAISEGMDEEKLVKAVLSYEDNKDGNTN